jgi:hypothetical protein
MKRTILAILALAAVPAMAAEPVYHDCRLSEDVVRGRAVHKTVCQNENGDWVEVHPPKKKTAATPTTLNAKSVKKPVYHDCRYSEDIVDGHAVRKAVCQNDAGDWVEFKP